MRQGLQRAAHPATGLSGAPRHAPPTDAHGRGGAHCGDAQHKGPHRPSVQRTREAPSASGGETGRGEVPLFSTDSVGFRNVSRGRNLFQKHNLQRFCPPMTVQPLQALWGAFCHHFATNWPPRNRPEAAQVPSPGSYRAYHQIGTLPEVRARQEVEHSGTSECVSEEGGPFARSRRCLA